MVDIEEMLEGIDLDDKKIQIDEEWYGSKELKSKIKEMIDAGEYEINKYADSLKRLESVIKDFKEIKVKIPITLIESYEKMAEEEGKNIDHFYRMALAAYIDGGAPAPKPKDDEEPEEEEEEEAPEEEGEEDAPEEEEGDEEAPEEEGEEEAPEGEEDDDGKGKKKNNKVVRVACHNCKRPITITTSKRPITVICEHCGARGQLSQ